MTDGYHDVEEFYKDEPADPPTLPVIVTKAPETGYAMSEEIAGLTVALAKAQGKITGAMKSLEGQIQNRKYSYADLAGVYNACRDQLCEAKIAVVQFVHGGNNNASVTVTTMLAWGNEWMRCSLTLFPTITTPQGVGSAITYARRYALAAMVGVAPEDDDGKAASAPAAREDDGTRPTPKAPAKESARQELFRKIQFWSQCQPEDVPATATLIFAHAQLAFPAGAKLTKVQISAALGLVESYIEQKIPFLDVFPPKTDVPA